MKALRSILYLLAAFLIMHSIDARGEWLPYGPGTTAICSHVFFYVDNAGHSLITSGDGFYLNNQEGGEWAYYTYGNLPVCGACYFDGNKIIMAMGDGTYSDGIWLFNPENNHFEVLEWLAFPTFLYKDQQSATYYCGHEYGLMRSVDGLNWQNITEFQGKNILRMSSYANAIVILSDESSSNLYYSTDSGENWSQTEDPYTFSEIDFGYYGDLFSIFPGTTESAGLYHSTNNGLNSNGILWEEKINCLKCECSGKVCLGWKDPWAGHEGITIFDPANTSLQSLNNNLPDLHINSISVNPGMSAPNIFACTDSGVFYSIDYLTGIDDQALKNQIKIFPNPVNNQCSIFIYNTPDEATASLSLVSSDGRIIKNINDISSNNNEFVTRINLDKLNSGIYFCIIKIKEQSYIKKIIKTL